MMDISGDTAIELEETRLRILRDIITSRVERNYVELMLAHGFDLDELFEMARKKPRNPYLVERRKTSAPKMANGRRRGDPKSIMRGQDS